MRLINQTRQSITLHCGVILAAAGTPGSAKEVEALNDIDRRRHVETGRIAIAPEPEPEPAKKVVEAVELPATEDGVSRKDANLEEQPRRTQRAQRAQRPDVKEETSK